MYLLSKLNIYKTVNFNRFEVCLIYILVTLFVRKIIQVLEIF